MKFITKEKDLIGKKIKYVNLLEYDATIIVSEENEILISDFSSDYDSYSTETEILKDIQSAEYILGDNHLIGVLIENEIVTVEEINQLKEEKAERKLKEEEAYRLRQLESKRQQFERLKIELGE